MLHDERILATYYILILHQNLEQLYYILLATREVLNKVYMLGLGSTCYYFQSSRSQKTRSTHSYQRSTRLDQTRDQDLCTMYMYLDDVKILSKKQVFVKNTSNLLIYNFQAVEVEGRSSQSTGKVVRDRGIKCDAHIQPVPII